MTELSKYREELAEVLAGHSIRFREHEGDWAAVCKCGEIIATNPGIDVPNAGSEFYPVVIRGERTHVADALLPVLARVVAEAKGEALREAGQAVLPALTGPVRLIEVRRWLFNRAEASGREGER